MHNQYIPLPHCDNINRCQRKALLNIFTGINYVTSCPAFIYSIILQTYYPTSYAYYHMLPLDYISLGIIPLVRASSLNFQEQCLKLSNLARIRYFIAGLPIYLKCFLERNYVAHIENKSLYLTKSKVCTYLRLILSVLKISQDCFVLNIDAPLGHNL